MRWLLDLAYPLIGNRPIADLTAPELLEALRTVEVRGRYETANRLRSTFGTIFRYARGTHWDERVRMMRHWSNYLDGLQTGAKILKGNFKQG